MASQLAIPRFLLPQGISHATLRYAAVHVVHSYGNGGPLGASDVMRGCRCYSTSFSSSSSPAPSSRTQPEDAKQRVLGQPDKFRPPSHPARRVMQTRTGRIVGSAAGGHPHNYPGPPLSEKEKEEQKARRYPKMFPPEGTVLHKFLTTRWIHVWIAMV
jgi:hypothetical protein